MLSNALTEDPTIFDYDSVYDEMQEKKRQTNLKNKSKKETKVYLIKIFINSNFFFIVKVYRLSEENC